MIKNKNSRLYLVENVSVFRTRYAVEAESIEEAENEVKTNMELAELGQRHLSEVHVSSREITHEEVVNLFFEDTPYLRDVWSNKTVLELVNVVPPKKESFNEE